jgi:hypothetical protein
MKRIGKIASVATVVFLAGFMAGRFERPHAPNKIIVASTPSSRLRVVCPNANCSMREIVRKVDDMRSKDPSINEVNIGLVSIEE